MWEHKIDDKECEVEAEANKKAKKAGPIRPTPSILREWDGLEDLETALKKLQTDETYLKVKEDSQSGGKVDASQLATKAREEMTSNTHLSKLVPCVRAHLGAIGASIVVEGQKNKHFHGRKQVATLAEDVTTALTLCKEVGEVPNADDVPGICEAVVRAALGDAFDAHADGGDDDDEMLLRVENLLLMYGAGHLLLKDTTLEMRKNCRYGVVGHNGAGKTTLMKEIAAHRIVGMPSDLKCVHVDDSKLGEMSKSYLTALEYCIKMAKDIGVNDAGRDTLLKVGFDEAKLNDPVSELSTGWRMRLTLAVSMLKHADLVLLDEPTNHLDEESVRWLSDYILSITSSSVMVISHEPKFLNKICTHVVAYVDKKLEYTEGNFDTFAQKKGLSREQIDSMLSGNLSFDTKKEGEDEEEGGDVPKVSAPVAGPPKLTFPIPGSMEGVKTGSKSVLEIKHVSFRFSKDKDYLFQDCTGKLSLSSRVAICGRNGCGKSTLMTLLCSELHPSDNKDGGHGEVWRHHNLRLAYMKQDHLKALGPFFDTSPFVYITERFKDGYDGDLQKRLIEPEDEEDALRRKELAKQHGKYGNEVAELVSRTKVGNHLAYEVRWDGLDDPKQNTVEPISKLKAMGLDKVIIACDERIAAKAAGLDQRPLTRREIVRHCEAFGIDEEMCCNRQIRGFSAGQKVRLSLAAMFWTKPHFIALDEPTNYLDVETVDALGKALTNFRGGIIMIEPKSDFVERICNEKWVLEDGVMKHEKLNNGVKRQA
ncbi:TEF3 [Symbiodinium sp. KB8]|nr:TEF3 [Symbiodinium sp. KB8]